MEWEEGGGGGGEEGEEEEQSQSRQSRDHKAGVASFQMTFSVKVMWGSHSIHPDLRASPALLG